MGNVITPDGQKKIIHQGIDYQLEDIVADIAIGEYALVIGREAILNTEKFDCNDSENVLLGAVLEVLNLRNQSINNLSDASDQFNVNTIKKAILQTMKNGWSFDSDKVDPALCELLKSGVFKTIIVTTFDSYVENVLKEVWKDKLCVNRLWDTNIKKSELGIPTLYYAFGKADVEHPYKSNFVVSDLDRLKTIQYLLSPDAKKFLKEVSAQRLLAIGNKMDDWLFRFFWFALTNGADGNTKRNRVIQSFVSNSDSDANLKKYLGYYNFLFDNQYDPHIFISKLKDKLIAKQKEYLNQYNCNNGVFISYGHENRILALHLYKSLKEARIDVWMDIRLEETTEGNNYDTSIKAAIDNARVFIPLLTTEIANAMIQTPNRYVFGKEWRYASQYMVHTNDGRLILFPIAVAGYDTHQPYHIDEFENNYFTGVANATVHRMDQSDTGRTPMENIIVSLKETLRRNEQN